MGVFNISQWYCIPPEGYLQDMVDWSRHMIIAPHLNSSEVYRSFYMQNKQLYTLIDNGLWEGQVVSNEELLRWANILDCAEIIAPDSPSGDETLIATKKFLIYLKKKGQRADFKIHGAVHGKEIIEQRRCLDGLINLGVDILDLPKMLGPDSRAAALLYIREHYPKTPVHYLGFYKEEAELLSGTEYPVRSFDTSVPFKPNYNEKFDLHLPKTFWNDIRIKPRIKRFEKLYCNEGFLK
jgi:hypothetical protein